MFYFKKMCETVHEQGGTLLRPVLDSQKSVEKDPVLSQSFVYAAKNCENFVFSSMNKEPENLEELEFAGTIDAPFKTFSIEVAGGPLSSSYADDYEDNVMVECIMVDEQDPTLYNIYTLFNVNGKRYVFSDGVALSHEGFWKPQTENKERTVLAAQDENGKSSVYMVDAFILKLIQEFLKRLSVEKEGLERVNDRVTVRSGGAKEIIKIKKVIHVTPKKFIKDYSESSGIEIDWSQSWFVRGHWRCFWKDRETAQIDLGKLGKDRSGNYCVQGRTWVTEHRKGPEHLVPVQKTRIIKT